MYRVNWHQTQPRGNLIALKYHQALPVRRLSGLLVKVGSGRSSRIGCRQVFCHGSLPLLHHLQVNLKKNILISSFAIFSNIFVAHRGLLNPLETLYIRPRLYNYQGEWIGTVHSPQSSISSIQTQTSSTWSYHTDSHQNTIKA